MNEFSLDKFSSHPSTDTQTTFTHQRHLDPPSFHRTFVSWLARPLAFCLMPVMITTLFMALQEQLITDFLKTGTAIAVCCAAGWTLLQMARTPATVSFRNERVLIKSFLESSLPKRQNKWHYVIDVQVSKPINEPFVTAITYGHTAFEFKQQDWEHFKALTNHLEHSRQHYEQVVQTRLG